MTTSVDIFTPAIREALARKGLTQEEFFARLGMSRRSIVDNFTMEKAAAVEFLLDTPAKDLWAFKKGELRALQKGRRDFNCRFSSSDVVAWARRFPVRELQNLGYIASTDGMSISQRYESGFVAREIMKFMGVASIAAWEKCYSIVKGSVNPHVYSVWLRIGELQVERPPRDFEIDRRIIEKNLAFLRNNAVPFRQGLRQKLVEALQKCDVTVLQVPAFLTAPAPRAACFWKGVRPVLQLPTGAISDGDFMESVYYAMGYILHGRVKPSCLVTADKVTSSDPARDALACRIAEGLLLSEAEECEIICCGRFAEPRCIDYFSRMFHVRPGVIVSRLQGQRKIPLNSPLNALKVAV